MHLRTDALSAIPASEPARLRVAGRRTTYLRAGLAAGLGLLLAACVVVARGYDVRHAPLVASGSSGVVVLDLSASVYEGGFEATVRKLVQTDERSGLVVFSDAAYELLPPGSSGREFEPFLRFFRSTPTGALPPNPWERFRAGTRISEGLKVARETLLKAGGGGGTIVLVSDLEVLPDEVQRLVTVFAELRRDGFEVRIVPLGAREERRRLVEQLLGSQALLPQPASGEQAVRAPGESLTAGLPWAFLLAGLALVVLLATNERLLARLEVTG
jgi:hypothetical protein